jgi:integrase
MAPLFLTQTRHRKPSVTMPKPRKTSLETPTSRRKLAVRKGSYFVKISPGISLGYRRNQGAGVWSVRATDGHGTEWLQKIALSDDLEPAAPPLVLDYWQAIEAARKLARKQPGAPEDESRPLTVAEVLDRYSDDLKARNQNVQNAVWVRSHLPGTLLSKPVALLSSRELTHWRDSLLDKISASSVNRLCGSFVAALNLAAAHDHRLKNVWKVGLQALPDADEDRNVILTDNEVRSLIDGCYRHDAALGLFAHVMSETGSRPSQIARLTCADLVADPKRPRVTMPRSGKGGGRNRVSRKSQRVPVAVSLSLAERLKAQAKGRASDAPLLLQSDGSSWGSEPSRNYRAAIREIVQGLGWNADAITLYSLRHSSVVRQLLAHVPVRIIATTHDTSIGMIERFYSRYISSHSDAHTRAALLDHEPAPAGDHIIALVR